MSIENVDELIRIAGKKAVFLIERDERVSMSRVSVNGRFVMHGNFWDFYPGCHRGLTQELGEKAFEWRGSEGLVAAMRLVLPKDTEVDIVRRTYEAA